jgi:hypothetical protein
MVIDQRNAGASVTIPAALTYTLDRWQCQSGQASKYTVQQNAGAVTPPAGYTNYLGVTSLSAYTVGAGDRFVIRQNIEGLNVGDLGFGTADAKTVTISFWVRSSLTGSFGGYIGNSAIDRAYPFSYTISAANTWEQKSITIAGDTSGTWLTTNGVGLRLGFGLGVGSTYSGTAGSWVSSQTLSPTGSVSVVGTSGATFYITGVQLEKGTAASPFENRLYGTELALCERYYQICGGAVCCTGTGTTSCGTSITFKTEMRASPTASLTAPLYVTRYAVADFNQSVAAIAIAAGGVRTTQQGVSLDFANFTGLPTDAGLPIIVNTDPAIGKITLTAEL